MGHLAHGAPPSQAMSVRKAFDLDIRSSFSVAKSDQATLLQLEETGMAKALFDYKCHHETTAIYSTNVTILNNAIRHR